VINYPYGTSTTQAKVAEAKRALMEGAQELSTPINAGYLFGEMDDLLLSDLRALCGLARMNNARCGVIVDVSVFSNEQIQKATQLANSASADRLLFSVSPQKNITDVIKILQMVDGLHFESLKFGIMRYITQIEQLSTLINAGFSRVGVENPQNILT